MIIPMIQRERLYVAARGTIPIALITIPTIIGAVLYLEPYPLGEIIILSGLFGGIVGWMLRGGR